MATTTFSGNTAIFNVSNVVVANTTAVYDVTTTFSSGSTGSYQFNVTGAVATNGQAVNFIGVPVAGTLAVVSQATPTPTLSPTSTQPPTDTPTLTPVPVSVPVVYPNPADGTVPVRVRPPAYLGVSNVKVRMFTLAFRKVQENTYLQVPAGTDVPINLMDKWGKPLASGLYYVVVNTSQGRTIAKLLILR